MTAIRALNPTLTRAGMRAIFNADDDGLQAKITHIAFGDQRYAPQGDETALQNEQVRIPVIGGDYLSDYIIELVTLLDHGSSFQVAEMGVILEDGTLLAVWSDPDTPLADYSPGVPIAISFVLGVSALPSGSMSISGDLDLTLFFGSEFAQMGTAIINSMSQIATLADRIAAAEETIDRLSGNTAAQAAAIDRIN